MVMGSTTTRPTFRPCISCGRLFRIKRSDQRCCDARCRKRWDNTFGRAHAESCAECGKPFMSFTPRRPTRYFCSRRCLAEQGARPRRRARRDRAVRRLQAAAAGSAGDCPWEVVSCRTCGGSLVRRRTGGRYAHPYCSPTCQRRERRARRRARQRGAYVEQVGLVYLCKRERWICQLCGRAVKRNAAVPHPLAPTTDHIVPISRGGAHSKLNTQLAHFRCNALKSDGPGGQLRLIG